MQTEPISQQPPYFVDIMTVLGARDFAVSCVVVWNSLPTDLRVSSLTDAMFARHLKAYLFDRRDS